MRMDRPPLGAMPGRRRFPHANVPPGFGWTGPLLGLLLFLALSGLSRMALGWILGAGVAALLGGILERFIRQIRYQAEHDALTGIHNRRPFERVLHSTCRRQPVSLLFIELDDFGQVNKRYGHLAGDQAMLTVSRLLSQSVRKSDMVARWGGDEFVIILPGTGPEAALRLAERIRATIAATPCQWEGKSIALSISTGVAAVAEPGGSPADLVRRAEQAHRVAKQRKNTVFLCS